MLDACVGCMTCVNACPDTAILGVAQPEIGRRRGASRRSSPASPSRPSPTRTARSHFARTTKYADVPARRGLEPALFGIFVDPVHCKGCAECVEVCHALGYDALRMIDKVPVEPTGESTVERYARDLRFMRTLPADAGRVPQRARRWPT